MNKERRVGRLRLPSTGTVLGAVALFVALQGTAFALPGLNSVDSGDIRNGQVKAVDIAGNAVNASKIRANAVRSSEIAADAVHADELAATWIVGSGSPVSANSAGTATATCPAGAQVISGGFTWDINDAGLFTTAVEINTGANSATVKGYNDTAFNRTLSARVYCIVA